MSVFNDWPVRVFCQFRDRCLHPMVKQGKTLLLQRTLWWKFLESLAVRGKSEQRTTTRPQISEIEIVNMEPYSHPSQLRLAVVDVKSWKNVNLLASRKLSKTVRNKLSALLSASTIYKYKSNYEVRLVFDRYDLPMSLKTATWVNRQVDQDPVY